MNKYKLNPLLIHVKEKEQTVRENFVFWVCRTLTPILNGVIFYWQIFLKKSVGNKVGKCRFFALFGKFKVWFCEIIYVWTYSKLKQIVGNEIINYMVLRTWTLFIALRSALGYKQIVHALNAINELLNIGQNGQLPVFHPFLNGLKSPLACIVKCQKSWFSSFWTHGYIVKITDVAQCWGGYHFLWKGGPKFPKSWHQWNCDPTISATKIL